MKPARGRGGRGRGRGRGGRGGRGKGDNGDAKEEDQKNQVEEENEQKGDEGSWFYDGDWWDEEWLKYYQEEEKGFEKWDAQGTEREGQGQ